MKNEEKWEIIFNTIKIEKNTSKYKNQAIFSFPRKIEKKNQFDLQTKQYCNREYQEIES